MFWALPLAILLGTALRCYRLGANSLWADELATLWLAGQAPAEILHASSSVNFIPPLYFLLVHGVLQIPGEPEVVLRLVSVIAGICTLPIVWLLTREVTASRRTADVASVLLAVHPLHLWFSQEARPYALLLLFGCCTLLVLVRAVRTRTTGYWVAFTVCGALTFLTHTTGVIVVAVAWAWVLSSPQRRQVTRPLLASSLAIGLLCAPFVASIAGALVSTGGRFHSPPRALTGLEVPYTLLTYVTGYSFGPATRDIQNWGAIAALRSHPIETAIAGAVLLGVLLLSWVTRRASMTFFVVLLGVPVGAILALSALSGKAYNVRYTLPALIGLVGLAGVAVCTLRPLQRALVLTVLIGVALWADAQWFYSAPYWKEDSRAAVAWLEDHLAPGAVIAVAPSYGAPLLAYYARRAGADLRFVPSGEPIDGSERMVPDALVFTRLHHVPNWRDVKEGFQRRAGIGRREVVVGYEMLVGCRSTRGPNNER